MVGGEKGRLGLQSWPIRSSAKSRLVLPEYRISVFQDKGRALAADLVKGSQKHGMSDLVSPLENSE